MSRAPALRNNRSLAAWQQCKVQRHGILYATVQRCNIATFFSARDARGTRRRVRRMERMRRTSSLSPSSFAASARKGCADGSISLVSLSFGLGLTLMLPSTRIAAVSCTSRRPTRNGIPRSTNVPSRVRPSTGSPQ